MKHLLFLSICLCLLGCTNKPHVYDPAMGRVDGYVDNAKHQVQAAVRFTNTTGKELLGGALYSLDKAQQQTRVLQQWARDLDTVRTQLQEENIRKDTELVRLNSEFWSPVQKRVRNWLLVVWAVSIVVLVLLKVYAPALMLTRGLSRFLPVSNPAQWIANLFQRGS